MEDVWEARKPEITQLYEEGLTLQAIGDKYDVTRERMRQVMERFGITRRRKWAKNPHTLVPVRRPTTLEEYLNHSRRGNVNLLNGAIVIRFLMLESCEDCGSRRFLEVHHLCYPAKQRCEVKILCKSCHKYVHGSGLTYPQRVGIYKEYLNGGISKSALARKHNVAGWVIHAIIRKFKLEELTRNLVYVINKVN